jgi:hypothetical protein
MAPTLTNYENIAVTLCLMSIAILRRRLCDRARVRRRATRSWLLMVVFLYRIPKAPLHQTLVFLLFLCTSHDFPIYQLCGLLRRKQRSAYNTLLKELHTEDTNEFRNYFRMDKTTIQSILLWFHLSILISYSSCWFSLSRLFIIMCFCFVNIISSFQNSIRIGWFPSKFWRNIGWSSIPSKLVKVFDQRFLWPLSLSKFSLTKKTLIVTTGLNRHSTLGKNTKQTFFYCW